MKLGPGSLAGCVCRLHDHCMQVISERVGHLAPWFDELEGVAGCVAAYSIPQNAGEYGGGDERIRRLHAFAICSNNHSEL